MIVRSILIAALTFFLVFSVPVRADDAESTGDRSTAGKGDSHGGSHRGPPGPLEADAPRGKAQVDLLGWSFGLFEQLFAIPPNVSKKFFSDRLPEGIENALKKGDEKIAAGVMADLFGVVNDAQVMALASAVKRVIAAKKDAKLSEDEALMMVVLQRILWSAKIVRGDQEGFEELFKDVPETDAFNKFKKAFDPEWVRVQEKNKRYYARLDAAEGGDEKAKADLRNYEGVASFYAAQAGSGNMELVNRGVAATSTVLSDGSHAMDFVNAKGEPVRVVVGKNKAKFGEALIEGFKELEHQPEESWFTNLAMAAKPHSGPVDTTIRLASSLKGDEAKKDAKDEPKDSEPAPLPPPPAPPVPPEPGMDVAAADAQFATFLKEKRCSSCHADKKHPFQVDEDGKILAGGNPEQIHQTFFENVPTGMKDVVDALTEVEKKQILDWMKTHEKK